MVFNIDLRILNWNYGDGSDLMNIPYSYHHLLRIFQLARLLSRDANIMKILISKGGVQIILNMIMHLHPKVLENLGHNETPYTPLLIEVISTAKRMHVYILEHYTETVDDADLLIDAPTKEDNITIIERTLPLLTDLLCCDNNILQICIIELIIQILSKRTNIEYFRNDQALENILAVLNNSDEVELKKRVLCLLIELMNDDQVLAILKDLNVLEVLANQLEQIRLINIHCEDDEPSEETSNMKVGFWDAFRVLSHITHDLLPEFRRLHIIGTLLDELELSKRVFPQMTLLEILTNLCMDDQNAVMIRECGVHIIGRKLLYASECIDEDDPIFEGLRHRMGSNSELKISMKQIVDEIQRHSLLLLRFLYSVQKNRKVFRLVFPPEVFGPFIDIGNYERDLEKYKLVKKINRLSETSKSTIMTNFEKIRDISSGIIENQKSVNGYNIIDIIGKGAFGIVYEVEKEGFRYAMKKIDISQYDHTFEQLKSEELEEDKRDLDAQVSEKICKEISILKGVDHPNIIKFYTSFVEADGVYIIMELHEGMSLADYIHSLSEKKQKVKEEVAWNIMFQLCSALRYLHYDMKILHRDFAPSNILLDENFTVKLIDFGLATRWGTQSASGHKSFVGTILYSCPEMVQNKKCTVKADVWSLGAIMYELLTLKQPFKGDNPLLIANKIVNCEYQPVEEGEYSSELIDSVKRCMTVDPKHRPNVSELSILYPNMVLKQMDYMRLKEISLLNKLKAMEHHRETIPKLSHTHAMDLNYTSKYSTTSPINRGGNGVAKTGGFDIHQRDEFTAKKNK